MVCDGVSCNVACSYRAWDLEALGDCDVTPSEKRFEEILGAVARGWCTPQNETKEMDSTLATAIANEVEKLFAEKDARIKELEQHEADWRHDFPVGWHATYSRMKEENSRLTKAVESYKDAFMDVQDKACLGHIEESQRYRTALDNVERDVHNIIMNEFLHADKIPTPIPLKYFVANILDRLKEALLPREGK